VLVREIHLLHAEGALVGNIVLHLARSARVCVCGGVNKKKKEKEKEKKKFFGLLCPPSSSSSVLPLKFVRKMSLSPDYLYDEVSMGQNLRTVGQLYATLLFSFSSFPKIPLFLFSSFSFSFSYF